MTTIELRAGGVRAEVCPADGGRLGQLELGGARFLKEYEDREHAWAYWGSYPLLPWSNRIVGGRFAFGGATHQLPINFADGTAIHGLGCFLPWDVVAVDDSTCTISVRIDTSPWTLTATQRFELSADGLEQTVALRNDGDAAVPVGIGIHPWFVAGPLRLPADRAWPAVDCIPTGPPRAVLPEEDLRTLVEHPRSGDVVYTGLTDTVARVGDLELGWRGPVEHVVVYTGEPGWICVEPVTNANDAFNLDARGMPGTGTIVLPPGASTAVTYTFRLAARD